MNYWPDNGPPNVWHAAGLGNAYASVVISNGSVYTIGARGKEVYCIALDERNGRLRWAKMIGTTGRTPCSTPTIDGDLLFVLDPDGDLVCLRTSDGKTVWQKSFLDDFAGRMMSGRGYGESPLVDGDRVICTPGGESTTLVALDKRTGETIWQSTMPEIGDVGQEGAGFSSIVVAHAAGVRQYVQLVGRGMIGVAAVDGKFLWGYNDLANQTANIPTPVVRDDMVFAANGYGAGSVLLRLVRSSDGGVNTEEVYRLTGSRFQNHHGGYVLFGDHIFGGHGSNNGLPTCLDLMSGRVKWKRRGPGIGSAAIVLADGHLYCRYQNGVMALIEATPTEYHLKSTFEIPGAGGDSWAHPAIANGRLYLREKDDLWVYDLTATSPTNSNDKRPTPSAAEITRSQESGTAVRHLDRSLISESADFSEAFAHLELNDTSKTKSLVVSLTKQHMTRDGKLVESIVAQLLKLQRPLMLNISGAPISNAGLQQIQSSPIVGLNLSLCRNVMDEGLSHLRRAQQLELLALAGTRISNQGLVHLVGLKRLVGLDLEFCDGVTDAGCLSLSRMNQLRALVLKKTGFESETISAKGLKELSTLTQLRALNLYGNQINDEGLNQLAPMKELRRLDLSLLPITDAGLVHLKALPRLQDLKLLYSTGFGGPTISDAGLRSLAKCSTLKSIDLTGAKITDDGLEHLAGSKQLAELKLVNTGVSDRGTEWLRQTLPKCRVVR